MSEDLNRLKKLLYSDNLTLAAKTENGIYKSSLNGIKPLFELVNSGKNIICAADKIVGRAAAFLYVISGAKEVYAEVLSVGAKEIFLENGTDFFCRTPAKSIVNRSGTDICPMDKAVRDDLDAKAALSHIKAALENL